MTTAPPPPDGAPGSSHGSGPDPSPGPDPGSGPDATAPGPLPMSPERAARHARIDARNRILLPLFLVVFLLAAILIPAIKSGIHRDYGVTWDEHVQDTYGNLSLAYYESGGSDTSSLEFSNLAIYPPAWEMGANLLSRDLDPLHHFERRHLLNALTGLLGVLALAGVGWRCGRPYAGIFGAVALLAMPRWFGHMFVNSKDIPFAVGFTLAMLAMVHAFDGRRFTVWRALAIGFGIGFTLSVRIGGMLLFAFGVAGLGLLIVQRLLLLRFPEPTANADTPPPSDPPQKQLSPSLGESPTSTFPSPIVLLRLGGLILLAFCLAWALMVAGWPWLHARPFSGPIDAFRISSAFPFEGESFFGGEYLHSWDLPRTYLPIYLGITVPLVTLALAAFGYTVSLWDALRRWRETRSIGLALLGLWLLFPVAYAVITRPNLYDGMRHFLFVLPALAWFAGQGVATLLPLIANRLPDGKRGKWLAVGLAAGFVVALIFSTGIFSDGPMETRWQAQALLAFGYLVGFRDTATVTSTLRLLVAIGLGLLLLTAVPDMTRLHPYQYTWYNRAAGGLAKAQFKYETDYWAASYREAIYRLNEYAKLNATADQPIIVLVAGNNELMKTCRIYASPHLELRRVWNSDDHLPEDFHFFMAFTRNRMAMLYSDRPIVSRIQREGAIFSIIRAGLLARDTDYWWKSAAWTQFPSADTVAASREPLSVQELHRNKTRYGQPEAIADPPPGKAPARLPTDTTSAPPPAAD